MNNTLSLFKSYIRDDLFENLNNNATKIEKIKISFKHKVMSLVLQFSRFVEFDLINKIKDCFLDFNLDSIEIIPRFPESELNEFSFKDLLNSLINKNSILRSILSDFRLNLDLENKKISIFLNTKGKEILVKRKFDLELISLVNKCFSANFALEFIESESNIIGKEKINEFTMTDEYLKDQIVENKGDVFLPDQSLKFENYENKNKKVPKIVNIRREGHLYPEIDSNTAELLIGAIINNEPIKILKIKNEAKNITIWGDVFKFDERLTRDGTKNIYSINITDYSSSITLKIIATKEKWELLKRIKLGLSLLVTGDIVFDTYEKSLTMKPKNINFVEKIKVMDTAIKKRVELHAHTNMSAMDGINPVKDLINRACMWGHKAIAITDHGVVQSFPDAMNEVMKARIAVLPGITAPFNSTVRETMFMGIPTIVYGNDVIDAINNEEINLISATKEDTADLGHRMLYALEHPVLMEKMAERTKLYAQNHFSIKAVGDILTADVKSVVNHYYRNSTIPEDSQI